MMKTQRLLDLVHFFAFACHGSLNDWLSCQDNEQVGSYASKRRAAAGLAHAIFIWFYRFRVVMLRILPSGVYSNITDI